MPEPRLAKTRAAYQGENLRLRPWVPAPRRMPSCRRDATARALWFEHQKTCPVYQFALRVGLGSAFN